MALQRFYCSLVFFFLITIFFVMPRCADARGHLPNINIPVCMQRGRVNSATALCNDMSGRVYLLLPSTPLGPAVGDLDTWNRNRSTARRRQNILQKAYRDIGHARAGHRLLRDSAEACVRE